MFGRGNLMQGQLDFGLVRLGLTNRYHDRVCAGGPFLVGLVAVTNPYHAAILGQGLPRVAFTNHYHREEGLGIIDCYNVLGTVIDCG